MAHEFYVTIEGTRQGRFKGESPRAPYQDRLAGIGFSSGVRSPRDTATGGGAGKRQHQPVTFRKQVGGATPQIALAACTNEVLRSVLFEFVRATPEGGEEIAFTIKLHNATVSEHRILVPDVIAEPAAPMGEEVSLTFQRIEWEHRTAHTLAADDWGR